MFFLQINKPSFLQDWWEAINKVDQKLFLIINHAFISPYTDKACLAFREPNTWIPLYIFMVTFAIWKFKSKSWIWILLFILTVTLSDQISSNFLKNYFNRIRPCGDPAFSQYVRLVLGRCPTSGSFTSSHAANHFSIAFFVIRTLKPYLLKWRYMFIIWACIVSYSQMYVGVHYPLDILGGTLLGLVIGYATSQFYLKKIGYPKVDLTM